MKLNLGELHLKFFYKYILLVLNRKIHMDNFCLGVLSHYLTYIVLQKNKYMIK